MGNPRQTPLIHYTSSKNFVVAEPSCRYTPHEVIESAKKTFRREGVYVAYIKEEDLYMFDGVIGRFNSNGRLTLLSDDSKKIKTLAEKLNLPI